MWFPWLQGMFLLPHLSSKFVSQEVETGKWLSVQPCWAIPSRAIKCSVLVMLSWKQLTWTHKEIQHISRVPVYPDLASRRLGKRCLLKVVQIGLRKPGSVPYDAWAQHWEEWSWKPGDLLGHFYGDVPPQRGEIMNRRCPGILSLGHHFSASHHLWVFSLTGW